MKPSFRKVPHSRSHARAAARPRQAGQGMTEYIAMPQDPRQHWICCPISMKCPILRA